MNEDLSGMIRSIMASPEFNHMVKELKGTEGTTVSPDAVMQKLPEVLGMLGQSTVGAAEGKETLPVAGKPGGKSTPVENAMLEQALTAMRKMDNQKCERLLGALKPYLRPGRGEVIDKAVSVMKITDILGALQDAGLDQ